MIEDEKLTAREKRKLRREFSQLDRDSVRYNLQIGGYGVAQRWEPSIQDIERLLLQASTAIQRLISERDGLRRRVQTLENEVTSLGQRMKLVQDGYRRLATEFVSQLRLLDNGVGELFGETIQPETFSETKAAASDIRDDHNY
jgi:hypothetical protein